MTMESYASQYLHLHNLWKANDKKVFSDALQQNFASAANPYKLALVCIKLCPDLFKSKNNGMAVSLAVELQSFLNKQSDECSGDGYSSLLTEDMQMEVFEISVRQKNTGMLRVLVAAYRLFDIREKLIPKLHVMIGKQQYKEVCTLATLLSIQEHFSTLELLVPLFCLDRLCLADEFLNSSPPHQKEIVLFIDNVIGREPQTMEILQKFNITDVKRFKPNKILSNTLARLLKRFHLDMSFCPHFYNRRAMGGLRYLFYKYYVENGLQASSFHSLVEDSVQETPDLKKTLMDLFCEYCDPQSAVPYVHKFQLDHDTLPQAVKEALLTTPPREQMDATTSSIAAAHQEEEEEWWDVDEDGSYQLSVPQESIKLIESLPEMEKCLEEISSSSVIGLDNEWKPTFGIGSGEQISLMQIATPSVIYLIDILNLQPHLEEHHWTLMGNLYSNANITKLGYGIKGDFRILSKLHGELKKALMSPKNVIDFDKKKASLLEACPDIFLCKTSSYKGLSDFVYRCFGKPLNKNEQFSNWSNRPLTRSQKLYAALDARCLIDIYDYLNTKAQELGIEDWRNIKPKPTEQRSKLGKKARKKEQSPTKNVVVEKSQGPIAARDFHVVCDTMLQGLAKKLRLCGVDAIALENGQSPDDCIEYFEKEKRYVLSRGASYRRLAKFIPSQYVFHVESEGARQQLEEVMKSYKVELSPGDLFARCTKCNSGCYMKVPPTIIRKIKENENCQCLPDDWRSYDGGKINLSTGVTEYGIKLKVEKLIVAVVEKAEVLFVCARCGRCYWEGSHQERAFKEIISQYLSNDNSDQHSDFIVFSDEPRLSENDIQGSDELPGTSLMRNVNQHLDTSTSIPDQFLNPGEGNPDAVLECNLQKKLQEIQISN